MAPQLRAKAKAKGVAKSSPKARAGGAGGAGAVAPSSGLAGQGKILKDGGDVYDVNLNVQDSAANMSKFYKMQVVESTDKSKYWFVQHWGRIGTAGQTQVKGPTAKDKAIKLMVQKFRQKSGKKWEDRGSAGPGSGDSSARAGRGHYELDARLKAAGAKRATGKGAVAVSLMWEHTTRDKRNDLDLWVTPPSGEKIGFNHKKSKCGGQLDVDRQQNAPKPVENIVWTKKAPKGNYTVKVHNFSASHQTPMPFEVGIVVDGGEMKMFKKTMPGKPKAWVTVKSFKY